jgi:hypothetical protein
MVDEMQMINANTGYGVFFEDLKTTNGGINWQIITGNHYALEHHLSFINEFTGFIGGISDQDRLDLHKTTNGGNTWILIQITSGHFPDGGQFNDIKLLNSSVVYVTYYWTYQTPVPAYSDYNLIKSTDGGNLFINMMHSTSMEFYEMQFPSANTGFAIASDSTGYKIIKSVNDNWGANICFSTSHTIKGIEFPSVNTGYAICDSGLVYKTTNSGTNWFALNTGTTHLLRDIKFMNNLTGWVVGDSGLVLKTTTGGETPVLYTVSGTVKYQDNSLPVTSGYVKAIKYDSTLFNIVTVDSAQIQPNGSYTFTHIPPMVIDIMAYENDEEELSFVPTYYISTINWQNAVNVRVDSNISNINISVKRTVNQGNSFHISGYVYTNNTGDNSTLKDAIIYSRLAGVFKGYSVSLSNGYYCIDSLPPGVHELIVDRMGYEPANYILSITNSNIDNVNFYLDNTLVQVPHNECLIPDKIYLSQNYPNPFNPKTIIGFQIDKSGFTNLTVYDILGKSVVTLVNEDLTPGNYKAEFDGTGLASGLYFYRLEVRQAGSVTVDFIETKKFVLLK